MTLSEKRRLGLGILITLLLPFWSPALCPAAARPDPLPSWNEGSARAAIIGFVEAVVTPGSGSYVPPAERIAVFDNDGTLWSEQPGYVEWAFVTDRIRELAANHPDWSTRQPFKALLEGDWKALQESGQEGMQAIYIAAHSGVTTAQFEQSVRNWIAGARHPRFHRPYTDLVYQPMLELLAYLRGKDFKTFLVSGGSSDFIRPWALRAYGIPPEQVVGTSQTLKYEWRAGNPVLTLLPRPLWINEGEGKVVGIQTQIGRRPLAAFGNSDGDLPMLQWTAAGEGPRFPALVHHTDAQRESAYDRQSPVGRLDEALDEARKRGWTVIDMQRDWKRIFPFQEAR
jgi:phosphoglycolate phosphatase-like HAD superfamily hydrolase